jgi:ribose-phosphate pyrophosphokinase
MSVEKPILLTGTANPPLAYEIGKHLGVKVHPTTTRFADNEARIDIKRNIRKKDVFIIQPTCPPLVDNHYIELIQIIDAAKRASASDITAVIPYFGYSRQDRKDERRTSIAASRMARSIVSPSAANRILTVDLHAEATEGAIDGPWDNLYSSYALIPAIQNIGLKDIVVASPDVGGATRALKYSELLNLGEDIAIVVKRRDSNKPNQSKVIKVIGDVEDRDVLLVDDMYDTGGTLTNAAYCLQQNGARSVRACIAHGLFSADAIEKLNNSPITEMFITDSILPSQEVLSNPKIKIVTIAPLLTDAIRCIQTGESMSKKLLPKNGSKQILAHALVS